MRRRDFITLLGGTVVAWPLAARAQQPGKSPTIGFLGATTPTIWSPFVGAFLQRLRELGWIDGRDIAIEYRWAEGRDDRYAAFVAEFVQRRVDVIVTAGTTATMSVKKATSTIPIVFASAGDPVGTGLVASLARPGGNVTGLSNMQTDLGGLRLELLREVVPALNRVAVLGNADSPLIRLEIERVQAAAVQLGLDAFRLEIMKVEDIIPSIEAAKGAADALYVCSDPFLTMQRVRIKREAAMRLVACLTMCLMAILVNGAQTDAQAPSDPQAYCVNRSAEFYPYTGEPCKSGYQLGSGNCRKTDGPWLPCQES